MALEIVGLALRLTQRLNGRLPKTARWTPSAHASPWNLATPAAQWPHKMPVVTARAHPQH